MVSVVRFYSAPPLTSLATIHPFQASEQAFKQERKIKMASLCRPTSLPFVHPATPPSFLVHYSVFDIHSRCSCHSFQPPSLLSRYFSLPLERCRSRTFRRSRKETSKPEPFPSCQRPPYQISLLLPNLRGLRIASSPRSRPGPVEVSRIHYPDRSEPVT